MCVFLFGLVVLTVIIFETVLWLRGRSYDGKIVITQDLTGKKLFSLELDKAPLEIEQMKTVTFKVVPSEDS